MKYDVPLPFLPNLEETDKEYKRLQEAVSKENHSKKKTEEIEEENLNPIKQGNVH